MRAVEELVRRKLKKRTPDELLPKPDPYKLCALTKLQSLVPYSNCKRDGRQSGQHFNLSRATFLDTKSNRYQTSTAIDRQTRFLKYNRNK